MRRIVLTLLLTASCLPASAADWPTYRGDAARSGYTAEKLPAKLLAGLDLSAAASRRCPPGRATIACCSIAPTKWSSPAACCSSAARPTAASSRSTRRPGQERWTFFTDAPVRFAPAVWKDRVFVASDDGYLYCLALADGSLIQQVARRPHRRDDSGQRPDGLALAGSRRTGHSRWHRLFRRRHLAIGRHLPAGHRRRIGPTSCGATTRRARSTCRSRTAARWPKAASRPRVISSPRPTQLLVPTGRAVPAAFRAQDGKFPLLSPASQRPRRRNADRRRRRAASTTAARRSTLATGALEGKLGAGRGRGHARTASSTAASRSCAC